MCTKWQELQSKGRSWLEEQATGTSARVQKMLARMRLCDSSKHDEGVFSSHLSIALQRIVSNMPVTENKWHVVYQFFVHDKSGYHVDIAMVDDEQETVHSLIEVKRSQTEFPESEATAYAYNFKCDGVNPHKWLPVFAISANHLQFGVAFDGVGESTATDGHILKYSMELFHQKREVFSFSGF